MKKLSVEQIIALSVGISFSALTGLGVLGTIVKGQEKVNLCAASQPVNLIPGEGNVLANWDFDSSTVVIPKGTEVILTGVVRDLGQGVKAVEIQHAASLFYVSPEMIVNLPSGCN